MCNIKYGIMEKFLSSWYLNAIVSIIAVAAVFWQELTIFPAHWCILGTCAGESVGGSLLAELIKIIGAKRNFSIWQFFLGAAVGVAASAIVLFAII